MPTGATGLLAVHHGISVYQDRLLGTRWFVEDDVGGKLAGVFCRVGKYLLLDRVADHSATLVQHEVFGHGARLRELGYRDITYDISLPPPYGSGNGRTSWDPTDRIISDCEMMSIVTGGIEANAIIAQELAMRWLARGSLHYREAGLYLRSAGDLLRAVSQAEPIAGASEPRSDITRYVALLNQRAGHTDPAEYRFRVRDLERRAMVNLVNPFLITALITQLKTGFWAGDRTAGLPMLRIGAVGYLPALRMVPTPFGPEYHLEAYLRFPQRGLKAYLRLGEPVAYFLWGGAGITLTRFIDRRSLSVDLSIHIWGQPSIELGGSSLTTTREGLGGALSLRVFRALPIARLPISLAAEFGYKSVGYLEGHPLDEAVRLMLGFAYEAG